MSKIVTTAQKLVSDLKTLESRTTYYKNKWPDNLLYVHEDGRTSADCVNLYKALFNGYNINVTKTGYYQHDLSNTGDCDEWGLLSQCSDISQDFTKLKNGEPRQDLSDYLTTSHAQTTHSAQASNACSSESETAPA